MGQPWSDAPLTAAGQVAARELGKGDSFTPTTVYCSPYLRTMTTATCYLGGVSEREVEWKAPPLTLDLGLSEFQPNHAHHISLYPDGMGEIEVAGEYYPLPESVEQFEKRVRSYLTRLCQREEDGDILCVTHGAFVRSVAHILFSRSGLTELPFHEVGYLSRISFYVVDGEIDYASVEWPS